MCIKNDEYALVLTIFREPDLAVIAKLNIKHISKFLCMNMYVKYDIFTVKKATLGQNFKLENH